MTPDPYLHAIACASVARGGASRWFVVRWTTRPLAKWVVASMLAPRWA